MELSNGVFELLCRSSKTPSPMWARPRLEMAYYRRGKNSHVHAVPKSCTPAEYAKATGLEALFGALYLSGQTERINELFKAVMEET